MEKKVEEIAGDTLTCFTKSKTVEDEWDLTARLLIHRRPLLDTWVNSVDRVFLEGSTLLLMFIHEERFFAESLMRYEGEIVKEAYRIFISSPVTDVKLCVLEKSRRLPEVTPDEKEELVDALCDRAIEWADKRNVGGLSCAGEWNLYESIKLAVMAACNGR
jgi:hypothetical protein